MLDFIKQKPFSLLYKHYRWICTIVILGILLTSCQTVGVEVGYKPPVLPLRVSINSWGEITFGVEGNVEIPTFLGTFSAGIVVDPARKFNAQNILTVRVNGEDHFYDLHGEDFDLEFESGYYEKITLRKNGNSIVLELNRIQTSSNSVPVQQNPQTNRSQNTPNNNQECSEAFSPRLTIGRTAQVVVFQVTVRTAPGQYSSKVNYLAKNRVVLVLDGPRCAGGWWWWEIYSDELEYGGWVAEADEENYYLSP